MNIDQLKQKLLEIDAATLRDFILDLYLQYPGLSDRIETLILYNDPAALAKALDKRLQSIRRGRKFIDYRASFDFSRELESLLADIESGLLESSPGKAFELFDKFLATADAVLNRIDDSAGVIGEVYRQAVLLWLASAKSWQDTKVNWLERVYQLYQKNDYGVLDPLLPNAQILLTQDQLKQLAWRYEAELREALKSPIQQNEVNFAALRSGVALGSIADALSDPALYERALLIGSPQPNNLQMKNICEKYLQYEQPEPALRYLSQAWERHFENDRLRLLSKVYEKTGDMQQLKQVRYQIYQNQQNHSSFKDYLDVLDIQERDAACHEAIKQAEQGGNILSSAELLLNLNQPDRAQVLILSRHQELTDCFYDSLRNLAKALEQADCDLAATACYRALLLDILKQARSTAYAHAARYFKKLEILARRIKEFKPLSDHHDFVRQLQSVHGRKKSFWARIKPDEA